MEDLIKILKGENISWLSEFVDQYLILQIIS
jgi:hypothetical protein